MQMRERCVTNMDQDNALNGLYIDNLVCMMSECGNGHHLHKCNKNTVICLT